MRAVMKRKATFHAAADTLGFFVCSLSSGVNLSEITNKNQGGTMSVCD